MPGCLTQARNAPLDSVLHTAWDAQIADRFAIPSTFAQENITPSNQRFQRLFDEKGITLSEAIDCVQELNLNRPIEIENGSQHARDVIVWERSQYNFLRESLTI